MANEATNVTKFGENGGGKGRAYTITAASVIPTGTLLALTGDDTVSPHSSNAQIPAGIAAFESTSTSTFTQMTALTDVEADVAASGSITRGQYVVLSETPNMVRAATNAEMTSSYALIFGVATRTAASGRVKVKVNL